MMTLHCHLAIVTHEDELELVLQASARQVNESDGQVNGENVRGE